MAAPASTDATLSALALTAGTTSTPVALSPVFAGGTTTGYRAWVVNSVSSVTVTATKNDSNATVAIANDDDTGTPGSAVLSLSEGRNTITVTVTAEDGSTTKTYTATAVRVASAPTADPNALLTANVTVGETSGVFGYFQAVSPGWGAMTDDDFVVGGSTYGLWGVLVMGGTGVSAFPADTVTACFRNTPTPPTTAVRDKLVLSIDGHDFALAGTTLRPGASTNCYSRSRAGLTPWAWGDVATVKIASVNNAPVITTTSPQSVAENTTAVATLAATDADGGDTHTWSLNGGDDAGKFSLTTAGVLTFTTAPNFENPTDTGTDNGYEVIVRVNDGTVNVDLALTVNVTDVAEKPAKPATPTVSATTGSTTSLDVDWDKPGLNGGPDITGYNVQYRVGTSGAWTDHSFSGTDTETKITGRTAGTEHQARVQAINGETDSDWSEPGTGSTGSPTNTPATGAPTITGTAHVGQTLAAGTHGISDADGLTDPTFLFQWIRVDSDGSSNETNISGATFTGYTLVDADVGKKIKSKVSFQDDDGNDEMLTSAAYPASGTVAVSPTVSSVAVTSTPSAASDTYGAGEAIEFTVTFSEAVEVSTGRPHFEFYLGNSGAVVKDAAYQSGSGTTALVFVYTVVAADVDTNGIWIGNQSETLMLDSGEYIRAVDDQTSATLTHARLNTQSGHKVDGSLSSNNAPVITTTSPQSVAENTTAVATLAATDADGGDTHTWSLNGGDDAGKFTLTGKVLTFTDAPDFENPADTGTDNGYAVNVRVNDGTANVDLALTVNVTDVAEKPAKPATPTVSATTGSTTSLDVDWDKPGRNGGPDITGYNVQYRVGTSGAWTDVTFSGTDTETKITGRTAGTEHQARVQAINGETDSDWSDPGTGSTNAPANAAPVFPAGASTRELTENVGANVNVGAPVSATDADTGDTLTYSFGGTDVGKFNFNTSTQQITTKTGQTYDYETDTSYTVTVTATDGTTPTTVTVTINVLNLPAISIAPVRARVLLTDDAATFVVSGSPAPAGNLTVPVTVQQEHAWIASVNIAGRVARYNQPDDEWESPGFALLANAPAKSGDLTVTLQPGDGYEIGTATATIEIVGADPLITVRAAAASYSPGEGDGTVTVTLTAETIADAPKPRGQAFSVNWSTTAGTATGGGTDFENSNGTVRFISPDFAQQGDRWVLSKDVEVTLVDDGVKEEPNSST